MKRWIYLIWWEKRFLKILILRLGKCDSEKLILKTKYITTFISNCSESLDSIFEKLINKILNN
jgi:hypothetical protein